MDEKPQLDENTLEAIAEFGDWRPTALPEGYSEYVSNGSPSKYGGEGGYGYVYRTYVNDAGYTIQLEYEFWRGVISYENQVYVFRNYRQNEYTVTDLTVQGLPAGLVETLDGSPALLTWVREGGDLVFKMRAENLTSEELLAVAESVALAP